MEMDERDAAEWLSADEELGRYLHEATLRTIIEQQLTGLVFTRFDLPRGVISIGDLLIIRKMISKLHGGV